MKNLPEQYAWLAGLSGVPNTLTLSVHLLGVKEVVGKGSNKTIIAWRDELNGATTNGRSIVVGYSDDDIPWCGLFVAVVCFRRMHNILEVVKDPLWARNWANYGVEVATRKGDRLVNKGDLKPSLGDVLVFVRNGGGHVGFYIGEDARYFHVIGGNQSNSVCITRVEKARCISVRRPAYKIQPSAVRPYVVKPSGVISNNEA